MEFIGKSWRTDIVGWLSIAGGVFGMIGDILMTGGLPQTLPEYFIFGGLVLGGIGHKLSKDGKVSNSPNPVAPKDVPPGV